MKLIFCLLASVPCLASAGSVRLDIDVNIIYGDGHINDGDKNDSDDHREGSGSVKEDNSDNTDNSDRSTTDSRNRS